MCRTHQTKAVAIPGVPGRFQFLRARAPSAQRPPHPLHIAAVHPQTTLRNPVVGIGLQHIPSANSVALRPAWKTRGSNKASGLPATPDEQ